MEKMVILGIKLSHDAGFALIDNGRLVFSYECEKIRNSPRYSTFNLTFDEIDTYMSKYGYSINDVDSICIDG